MSENEMHVTDWILESDIDQLRHPPEEISGHLRECLVCTRNLKQVLAGHAALDRGLDSIAQPAPRRRKWLLSIPLAAAAVIALVMVSHEEAPPTGPSPVLAQLMFPDEPVVTPAAGQDAVVIEKNDLTVVWLTNSRGN
ncbi:MAG TPA: hypothetical protein VM100_04350 [Longimicrobiales bacterium]|nr:hypothetical protein [Longimicrobiales bacterium]